MKHVFFLSVFFAGLSLPHSPAHSMVTSEPYAVQFTQEIVSLSANGSPLPSQRIAPETIEGMKSQDFSLGHGRLLRIETNIRDTNRSELDQIAGIVQRCYRYIEKTSGRALKKGVLLYLVEMVEIPPSYRFEATYADASKWGEVRMAVVKKGQPLLGPDSPTDLADLLYDTLPHELGHEIVSSIPSILHDIDGRPSFNTRWFIEGVCEVLAKGFARQESPAHLKHFLRMRNVHDVFNDPYMEQDLFSWAQENSHGMQRESDLYGAAFLVLTAWSESMGLRALLDFLDRPAPLAGADIMALLEDSMNCSADQVCSSARQVGLNLGQGTTVDKRRAEGLRGKLGG